MGRCHNKYPRTQRLIIQGEADPADILSDIKAEYPLLKIRSVVNLVTERDKALQLENPTLLVKSQPGLFVDAFELTQELIEVTKIGTSFTKRLLVER